jgi:predicted RNA-binding protein (virulence factor B family)
MSHNGYTEDELYKKAEIEVDKINRNLRQDIRQDAIQEYVIAATGCRNKVGVKNMRSYQQKSGFNRVVDFLRYEDHRNHFRYEQNENDIDENQLTPLEILEAKEQLGLFTL